MKVVMAVMLQNILLFELFFFFFPPLITGSGM
jgi:hypothetical protein